ARFGEYQLAHLSPRTTCVLSRGERSAKPSFHTLTRRYTFQHAQRCCEDPHEDRRCGGPPVLWRRPPIGQYGRCCREGGANQEDALLSLSEQGSLDHCLFAVAGPAGVGALSALV